MLQKIFSVKNQNNHKVVTILGIKINLGDKRKNKRENFDLNNSIKNIEEKIENIENTQAFLSSRIEDLYYDTMASFKVSTMHKYFSEYKNINNGKEVACIACGPTVNYYTPSKDMILCGINRATRKFDNLDYLFRHDNDTKDKNFDNEMNRYKGNNCTKFYGIHSPRRLRVNIQNGMHIDRIPATSFYDENVRPFVLDDSFHSKWAIDLEAETFGDIGGVVFSALQFLLYTHPKRIYLVGHDCTDGYCYKTDEKQHFGYRIDWYRELRDFAKRIYPDTEIVSVNPVGLKGIFRDIYTDEYIKSTGNTKPQTTPAIDNIPKILPDTIFSYEYVREIEEEKNCLLANYSKFSPKTRNNVYLLNDTRRDKNHIGCSLVYENISKLCSKHNMNIYFSDSSYPKNDEKMETYRDIISCCDVLLFNGEGTLYNARGINMFNKCKIAKELGKKVALINTVWQNNADVEKYLDCFDIISCRESLSWEQLPKNFREKSVVVPDLTFYKKLNNNAKEKGGKIIFTDSVIPEITDKLKNIAESYNADFYYLYINNNPNSKYLSEEIIADLPKDSIIITGRFHALTLGLKYEIPTFCVSSNTHKIEGLLKDADLLNYYTPNLEDIEAKIKKFTESNHDDFIEKSRIYCKNCDSKIEKLFDRIFAEN